jgi:hypothetical protein
VPDGDGGACVVETAAGPVHGACFDSVVRQLVADVAP